MKAEKEVIIRGISSVKNRLASRTHVNELKTLKAELIPLTGLPDADEKMRQEMNEAIIRLSQVDGGVKAAEIKLTENGEALLTISPRPEYHEFGEEIAKLCDDASAVNLKRIRVTELNSEIETRLLQLRNKAFELGLTLDRPDDIPRISAATKKQFDNIAKSIKEFSDELIEAEKDVKRMTRELERIKDSSQNDQFSESTLSMINSHIKSIRRIQEKENRLSDIHNKIARANLQLNSKLNALPLWQGNADSFRQIQIPSKELVENTEQDLRNAISDLKSVEQEFNNLQCDVKRR
ncbi:MAG: hypothetical protein ACKO5E_08515, partial [bacterium]